MSKNKKLALLLLTSSSLSSRHLNPSMLIRKADRSNPTVAKFFYAGHQNQYSLKKGMDEMI